MMLSLLTLWKTCWQSRYIICDACRRCPLAYITIPLLELTAAIMVTLLAATLGSGKLCMSPFCNAADHSGTGLELKLIMEAVLSTQPWLRDPEVVSIPWRSDIVDSTLARAAPNGAANDQSPLKFGIFWTDEMTGPHPPITRGLRMVVEHTKKAGHKVHPKYTYCRSCNDPPDDLLCKVVDWKPPAHRHAKSIHVSRYHLREDDSIC